MTARFRPSHRDQLEAVQAALAGQEAMYGDLRLARGQPQRGVKELPPKRVVTHRSAPDELEGPVKKAVSELLAVHPAVLFAVRQNAGMAWRPTKDGRGAPVWFFYIIRSHARMRIPDFTGFSTLMRPIAFECKRPGWKYNPNDDREREQREYLAMVRDRNGIAGFITDAMQAKVLLDKA